MRTIVAGDKVAYSANYLRSIGVFTGDLPAARAIVTEIEDLGGDFILAALTWDHPGLPAKSNIRNLALVGSPAMSAN